MTGRGFDHTDEGYYLLSYRWWDDNLRTFTGAQFFYGPLFEALDYHVPALRAFRLGSVAVVHGVLGVALTRWLRLREGAKQDRTVDALVVSAIVATGGILYAWLPLSPGYNDIAALTSLLLAASSIEIDTRVRRRRPIPLWLGVASGACTVVLVLAKWTSGVLTFVLWLTLTAALASRQAGGLRRLFVGTATGFVGATMIVHLAVVPLDRAVLGMFETNTQLIEASNSPGVLLAMHADTTVELLLAGALIGMPSVIAVLVAASQYGRSSNAVNALPVITVLVTATTLSLAGYTVGGLWNVPKVAATVVALIFVVAATLPWTRSLAPAGVRQRSLGARNNRLLITCLVVVPASQAVGTGNVAFSMALHGLAGTVCALLVIVETRSWPIATLRWTAWSAIGGIVFVAAVAGATGAVLKPYRADDFGNARSEPVNVPALSGVKLAPALARDYYRLKHVISHEPDPGKPVLAFDEMAGIVLAIDGRPVGEAWYSASDHARTIRAIQAVCNDAWVKSSGSPVILLNRHLSLTDRMSLRDCGIGFPEGYQKLPVDLEVLDVKVFAPTQQE